MTGINEGWIYLTNAPGGDAVFFGSNDICPFNDSRRTDSRQVRAESRGHGRGAVPGGRMHYRRDDEKLYRLIIGLGFSAGSAWGTGYSVSTPTALKWFGPHKRGLIAGLVVGGYGGAAIYISPLSKWLINNYGITGSFIGLGMFFASVICVAAQFLAWPPQAYVPPGAEAVSVKRVAETGGKDWSVKEW